MATLEELRQKISPDVRAGEVLAPHTTFRIGGPAEFFFEARTSDDAAKAARAAAELGLPLFILGGGSNTLVADEGVKGLVLKMANRGVTADGAKLVVEAGTPTSYAALQAAEAGLTGMEWAAGLPGTVGGAIRGNAGCYGGDMQAVVESVRVLAGAEVRTLTGAECRFGYRTSLFKQQPGQVVLSAVLALRPGPDPAAIKELMKKNVLDKQAKQPVEAYTAGCVFTNWKPGSEAEIPVIRRSLDLNKEEVIPFTKDGAIPAGWIIDRAQLKEMKVGHVSISPKHGNFFVNDGQGRASEVIALTSAVKMKVRDMTEGIILLTDEIEYAGF